MLPVEPLRIRHIRDGKSKTNLLTLGLLAQWASTEYVICAVSFGGLKTAECN